MERLGSDAILYMDAEGVGPLTVRTDGETGAAIGDTVFASPRAGREHKFTQGHRILTARLRRAPASALRQERAPGCARTNGGSRSRQCENPIQPGVSADAATIYGEQLLTDSDPKRTMLCGRQRA